MNVPSAEAFHVSNDNFETCEIIDGDRVECDIEEDEGPFKKCIYRVGFSDQFMFAGDARTHLPPAILCTLCWMKK